MDHSRGRLHHSKAPVELGVCPMVKMPLKRAMAARLVAMGAAFLQDQSEGLKIAVSRHEIFLNLQAVTH